MQRFKHLVRRAEAVEKKRKKVKISQSFPCALTTKQAEKSNEKERHSFMLMPDRLSHEGWVKTVGRQQSALVEAAAEDLKVDKDSDDSVDDKKSKKVPFVSKEWESLKGSLEHHKELAEKYKITWQPNPGTQSLFISVTTIDEVLMYGTRGNGKTEAILAKFMAFCGMGYASHWRGIVFRKSYKNLDDIVVKSKRMFNALHPSIRPRFMSGSGAYKWVWPTGEELLFRVMKDARQYDEYHGHEYPYIAWDELCNWSNLDAYESMKSCNRSSYRGAVPIPLIIVSTTNPYGVGHGAVKAYFIDPAPPGTLITDEQTGRTRISLFGHMRENPHLDDGYKQNLASITDPNKRRAWLFGSWDVNSGGIFSDIWSNEIHRMAPFDIPSGWKVDRSFDWGSSAPFAVCWYAESNGEEVMLRDGTRRSFPRGTVFLIREWYGCTGKPNEGLKMLASDVAKGILEREAKMKYKVIPGPADNSIHDVVDGHSIAKNMIKEGVSWTRSNKSAGSRVQGWEYMREMMANAVNNDGPGFYIFGNCVHSLRTIPTASRDLDNPDDMDTHGEDHICDSVRYRLYKRSGVVTKFGGVGISG